MYDGASIALSVLPIHSTVPDVHGSGICPHLWHSTISSIGVSEVGAAALKRSGERHLNVPGGQVARCGTLNKNFTNKSCLVERAGTALNVRRLVMDLTTSYFQCKFLASSARALRGGRMPIRRL